MKKRIKVLVDIINEMFRLAGHNITFDDIKDRKDDWYNQYTMTEDQYEEWQKWGTDYINKELKFNKKLASKEMAMIGLNYGLKFQKL